MKKGWHWTAQEIALVDEYIEKRRALDRSVFGYGSRESGVTDIAQKTGRAYDAVAKKISRRCGDNSLPRLGPPCWPKTTGTVRVDADVLAVMRERAKVEGLPMIRLINNLLRAQCPNANKRREG